MMTKLSSNKIAALTPAGLALLFVISSLSPIWSQQQTPAASRSAQSSGRDSLAVKALRAEAGKPSLYEVSFVTMDTLAPNAAIAMTFPTAFDLSQLEIAGSSTINGGFTLERKGQEVLIRRSGLGAKIPPGKKVSIQLGLIVNPANLSASHQVRVQLPPPSGAPTTAATPKNREVQFITSVN
ncbi:MAG: hypothetical protein ONB46_02560 [candidate division KSB1 bacterium]|nr:hypothetical protein [candidate division KSB1 bacterium]MDZ7402986.1 hypothetical protein [candidate division KSB1 bacterium]